jgi:glycosyltransferase involved in cell wall biosynthesis
LTAIEFRPAAIVPTFDNPRTVREVVQRLRENLADVIVVDDGSGPAARDVIADLGRSGMARTIRHDVNRGKGAAVKTGFAMARSLGFTHALQIDADLQHDFGDVPRFLAAARNNPEAVVLGSPVFDDTAPRARLIGRKIAIFWTNLETGGRQVVDPMCGFRVYPLAPLAGLRCGDRMDFDVEVAVRLVWRGVTALNLPTKVRYLTAEEGGVSHYRMVRDNLTMVWLHTRLVLQALGRLVAWPIRASLR